MICACSKYIFYVPGEKAHRLLNFLKEECDPVFLEPQCVTSVSTLKEQLGNPDRNFGQADLG